MHRWRRAPSFRLRRIPKHLECRLVVGLVGTRMAPLTHIAARAWGWLAVRLLGWCQGPESNWLRPPFQGGALPMSYPGTAQILERHTRCVKLSRRRILHYRGAALRLVEKCPV